MAHADYDCCARCDEKMAYNDMAETKEYVCADCAVRLFMLTGKKITDGESLAAFVLASTPGVVASLGITSCWYDNPVDTAVAQFVTVATEGGNDA